MSSKIYFAVFALLILIVSAFAVQDILITDAEMENDNYRFNSAEIDGDTLIISVSYSGGCEDHEFTLAWDGAWAKSNPPQATLNLYHESNDDPCEAFPTEELQFDLSSIGGYPEAVLHIVDYDGERHTLRYYPSSGQYCYSSCSGKLGDVDGDGLLTEDDGTSIFNMYMGTETPVACADYDRDCEITPNDSLEVMEATLPYDSARCSSNSLSGDANGDGAIDERDMATVFGVYMGTVPEPSDICCLDLDSDGTVTPGDSLMVANIIIGDAKPTMACGGGPVCTSEYDPVCGGLDVVCIRAPCDPVKQTYGNMCELENAGAEFLYRGKCIDDEEPQICTLEYAPVCGTDGRTYSNKCFAEAAGVRVDYNGECETRVCTDEWDPVCGVDGKTYSNKCYAESAGVKIAYYGKCSDDTCSRPYTCPDGTVVEACELAESYISEELVGVGCRCYSNPEELCPSSATDIKVELEEIFSLEKGQTAHVINEDLRVKLIGVDRGIEKCYSGECRIVNGVKECTESTCKSSNSIAHLQIEYRGDGGSRGTTISLYAGQKGEFLNYHITNHGISSYGDSVKLSVSKQSTPDLIKARLGELFKMTAGQQAVIMDSGANTVMKITDFQVINTICAYSDKVVEEEFRSTCAGGYPMAYLTVSFADGIYTSVSLGLEKSRIVNGYEFVLESLSGSTGALVIYEAKKPDVKYVNLDERFELEVEGRATVRQTGLQIDLVKISKMQTRCGSTDSPIVDIETSEMDVMPRRCMDEEYYTAVLEISMPFTEIPTSSAGGGGIAKTAGVEGGVTAEEYIMPETIAVELPVEVETSHEIVSNYYIYLSPNASAEIYGHTISAFSIDDSSAVLMVSQETSPRGIEAYLDEKFTIKERQTVVVFDAYIYEARYPATALKMMLEDIVNVKCIESASRDEEWRCDTRPIAKVSISFADGHSTYLGLREGEEYAHGNYTIHALEVGNDATFVVRKTGSQEYIKVRVAEKFDLMEQQTALVIGEDVYIHLQNTVVGGNCEPNEVCAAVVSSATISVWKGYGYPVEETLLTNLQLYSLMEGQSISIYGLEIKLLDTIRDSATFIVNKSGSQIINVHTDERFKMQEGMAARILEANMRIDLLSITELKKCIDGEFESKCMGENYVEISISNYLYELTQTGVAVDASDYEEIVTKTYAVKGGGITSIEAVEVTTEIALPPTPFKNYILYEGESVVVNDFEIKLLDLYSDTAVFIVYEKRIDLDFKLYIARGWNLISVPGEIIDTKDDCDFEEDPSIFKYNTKTGEFEEVYDGDNGEAYFLYNPNQACTIYGGIKDPISISEIPSLVEGWNFIPVTADMVGSEINSFGCDLEGAFFFDTTNSDWKDIQNYRIGEEDLGQGIALYSNSACTLGETDGWPEIPLLPELPFIGD